MIAQGADKQAQCAEIKRILTQELAKLQKLPAGELLSRRYERFRKF
ncbi:hypothetical protein [Lactobacillus nasalidis]